MPCVGFRLETGTSYTGELQHARSRAAFMLAGCLLEDTCDNKHIAAGTIQNVVSAFLALSWCQATGLLACSVVTWSFGLITKHVTAICILTHLRNLGLAFESQLHLTTGLGRDRAAAYVIHQPATS